MKKLGVQFNGGKAFIPGADYSGVIHAAGKNSKWTVGQEVHGMNLDMAGNISPSPEASRYTDEQETARCSNT